MAVAVVLFGLALLLVSSAHGDGTPNITLAKSAPARVLYGTESPVTLTAANAAGNPIGYNLSFRDVLPVGVSYVGGSSPALAGEPTVLANQPAAGQTTLIWLNVADLTPKSNFALTYSVHHSTTILHVGDSYLNQAGAYINSDPRFVPDFNASTGVPVGPQADSYTGFATASATTQLTAILLEKNEPNAEGEILRGVHDHQTVYTLTARNNTVAATSGLVLDDYLPAGLEYLGCGIADNTTDAPTNPGSPEEYLGAGVLNPGNAPAAPQCVTPTVVETVSLDPDGAGPLADAVYTHVRWTGLGTLTPGATLAVQYVAAIPIRENTMDWNGGVAGTGTPPGTGGAQGSNLDNNNGPETADEQSLLNYAVGSGFYNGVLAVQDDEHLDRTAEDLSVHKSVDDDAINQTDADTWTLFIESSEYRFVDDVRVTDTVPDGLCPLGPTNLEGTPECAPTGALPSAPYLAAVENPDGTWTLTWDQTVAPALARMQPSSSVTITFPTKTRTNFQESGADASPVLSHDSWTNTVSILGADFVRCAPGDPDCTLGQPKIDADEPDGTDDADASSASQTAGAPTIGKRVAQPGAVPIDCATATYITTVARSYGPGDRVCWLLRADFPSLLDTGSVTVTDFIPAEADYEPGSGALTGNNTIPAALDDTAAAHVDGGSLSWDLGTADAGSLVFEARFSTVIQRPLAGTSFDIKSNLMKMVFENTEGQSFPLRDVADFEWSEAELRLTKGVRDVNDGAVNGVNVDHVAVQGGDVVTYRVDVRNEGSRAAGAGEVWDVLPAGITCTEVDAGSISNGGTCNAAQDRIEWTGLAVGAKTLITDPAPSITLTYDVTIPADVAPNEQFDNHAGVRQYRSATDLGGTFLSIPLSNIDPGVTAALGAPNTDAADDVSDVFTPQTTISKNRVTEINEGGNNLANQATIGEEIDYTVTFTVPAGTTMYDSPTVVDPLGARQTYLAGTASATFNGSATLPAGVSLTDAGNTVRLIFPATYANAAGSGDDVFIITFSAQVDDDYPANRRANVTDATLRNTATSTWETQTGTPFVDAASIDTTLVEPTIVLTKNENDADDVVAPDQIIGYTLTLTNPVATRVSTAHDLVVTDVVPAGVTPVNAGVPILDGGAVTPDGGTWNQGTRTITWNNVAPIAPIAPGATVLRRYDVRVDNPVVSQAVFVNNAAATATSLGDPADDEGERTSASAGSPPGYSATATDSVSVVRLSLAKAVAPTTGTIGDDLVYTVDVTIPAGVTVPDATVIDTLPDGVDFDSYTSAVCTSGCPIAITPTTLPAVDNVNGSTSLGWFLGDIAADTDARVVTLVFAAHIDDRYEPEATPVTGGQNLVNSVDSYWNLTDTIIGTPTNIPSPSGFTSSSDAATATEGVREPALTIDKDVSGDTDDDDLRTAQAGASFTYTLRVLNTGTSPAYDVVVADQPDAELVNVTPVVGAGFITDGWTSGDPDMRWLIPGPIAVGATVTLTYTADLAASGTLTAGQTVVNTADVPSYFGVPLAERTLNGFDYREYDNVTPDTVTITLGFPQLTIQKTTGGAGFPESADAEVGQPFAWRVVVTNTSPSATAFGVDVTDVLPANWDYVAGSATLAPGGAVAPVITPAAGGDTLTWTNAADLAPGATLVITYNATPQPQARTTPGAGVGNPNINVGRAVGDDASGATGDLAGPYATGDNPAQAILRAPVLAVSKTPDGGLTVAGTADQYQIAIPNTGDAIARNVVVTDILPAGITYVPGTATAAGLTEDSVTPGPGAGQTTIVWSFTTIAIGVTKTILVPVAVNAPQVDGTVLLNSASVTADELEAPVADTGSLVIGSAPIWAIASGKTSNPAAGAHVTPSDVIAYHLAYGNTGNENATHVVISDVIPSSTTYVPGSATSTPTVAAEFRVAGAYQSVEPALAGQVEAVRFVVGDVDAGDTGTGGFSVTVDNPLDDGTTITNTAQLVSDQTPTAFVLGPVVHEVDSAPVLALTKTASDPSLVINADGNELSYTLSLANTGNENARDAIVYDSPPTGTTVLAIGDGGASVDCAIDAGPTYAFGACPSDLFTVTRVRWSAPVVTTSSPLVVTLRVQVPRPFPNGSRLDNVAAFETVQTALADSNPTQVLVTTAPRLRLVKQADPIGGIGPGQSLTYTLAYRNTGSATAHDVVLTDAIPAHTTYIPLTATAGAEFLVGGAYQASPPVDPAKVTGVRWRLDSLAVDASGTETFRVKSAEMRAVATITNTAQLAADTLTPVTDSTKTLLDPVKRPRLTIIKRGPKALVAGTTGTWKITIRSIGRVSATGVTLKDRMPGGFSIESSSHRYTLHNGVVGWKLGTLKAGRSITVSVLLRVAATIKGPRTNLAVVRDANAAGSRTAAARTRVRAQGVDPRSVPITG